MAAGARLPFTVAAGPPKALQAHRCRVHALHRQLFAAHEVAVAAGARLPFAVAAGPPEALQAHGCRVHAVQGSQRGCHGSVRRRALPFAELRARGVGEDAALGPMNSYL